MNLPIFGKPRFTRFVLAVFLLYFLLFHQTACLPPPLNLDCDFCFDGTCGVNTGFVCKDGYCVPEGDPNPARCKTSENTEGGVEKTEPTAESTPEESVSPEESATPEDGAQSEEPYIEKEPERPETPDTTEPTLTLIEGDDDQPQPISYPSGTTPPADAKPATFRFRTSWRIYGANLLRIERWELQSKDNTQTFTLTATDKKDTDMKLTLPAALTAGFFTLLGFIGNTSVVKAETFVLQGKDGKDGKDGAQGPKGDIGDNKFTDADATLLKALLTKLQANGDNLDITANTVTFKSATAQKVTLDLGNNATLKSGNATLDFAGDVITIKSTTFSLEATTKVSLKSPDVAVDATTFEVKGPGTTPTTSLKLDDTARSISLRVTQKNSNPSTQATFSLEGGDANTSPAPATKYPLAIFNRTNIQVQSGAGQTNAAVNGLGNLIVGYNEKRTVGNTLKNGSHNVIIGQEHHYTSHSGFVQGKTNNITDEFAGVFGGSGNSASSQGAGVFGGSGNSASGASSVVLGSVGEIILCQATPVNPLCQK